MSKQYHVTKLYVHKTYIYFSRKPPKTPQSGFLNAKFERGSESDGRDCAFAWCEVPEWCGIRMDVDLVEAPRMGGYAKWR